ncbi:hypothetical protein HDV05_005545 [Chytridiales sp. JEL 0842]|nr:hypothetical protein HDV05_005545 [Chytridiales sp. JEL 0842]
MPTSPSTLLFPVLLLLLSTTTTTNAQQPPSTTCPTLCPEVLAPVCANGTTYANSCRFAIAACLNPSLRTITPTNGACEDGAPNPGSPDGGGGPVVTRMTLTLPSGTATMTATANSTTAATTTTTMAVSTVAGTTPTPTGRVGSGGVVGSSQNAGVVVLVSGIVGLLTLL